MTYDQSSFHGWTIVDGVHRLSFRAELHVLECGWDPITEEWLYSIDGTGPTRSHKKRPAEDFEGARREALALFKSLLDSMMDAYQYFESATNITEVESHGT